jgi:hypothetical protein
MRLGRWLIASESSRAGDPPALFSLRFFDVASHMGRMAGQALLAWLLVAVPAVILMTAMLTLMLRRIPAVAAAEAGD